MSEKVEQRVCIKFCQRLGDTAALVYEKLRKVYGDDTMSQAQVYYWFKRFKDGREEVASDARTGRPTTSKSDENIAKVKAAVYSDRRITIREIAEDTGISFGSVQSILTENLGMRRVSAKFVPKLLSEDQKANRVSASTDLLQCTQNDENFMKTIVTGDESWVYGYDPETKAQSSQWKTSWR
jgi:[histone H3]-lysine36 N-dimethyltransferase SETMAR